jgi:hypothetical protein
VSLLAGTYTIEYRNVVSSVGPSGWYVSETPLTFTGDYWTCLDIKPGSWPNAVNTRAKGVIPVAVLGGYVDLSAFDPATLVFAGASPAHDLSDPAVLADHIKDVNGDGMLDLVAHFRTRDTNIAPGDAGACLYAGTTFLGCDALKAF